MFNRGGITTTTGAAPVQILANVGLQFSMGAVIKNVGYQTIGGRRIVKAGTPLSGNLDFRVGAPFEAADATSGTAGVYTLTIGTKAIAGDKIKITVAGNEHEFVFGSGTGEIAVGSSSTDQAGSLKTALEALADVASLFTLTTSANTIVFTQNKKGVGESPKITVTKTTAGTLAASIATTTNGAAQGSESVGVLLHDVDVTDGNANGTVLLFGFVNTNRIDTTTAALITSAVKTALAGKVTFIAC